MGKPLLARVQASNESWFTKLSSNARFRGVLQPVSPTQLPTSVFVLPRISLRVRLTEPVHSGELIRDIVGRIHLVGDHDLTLSSNDPVSRVHGLFQMTQRVSWKRDVQSLDPITKQAVSNNREDLGPIWASIESFTHTNNDPGVRVQSDRLRCITADPVQLNDFILNKTVKRVQYTLGVYVSEIE